MIEKTAVEGDLWKRKTIRLIYKYLELLNQEQLDSVLFHVQGMPKGKKP